jgi:hypothetical protein
VVFPAVRDISGEPKARRCALYGLAAVVRLRAKTPTVRFAGRGLSGARSVGRLA